MQVMLEKDEQASLASRLGNVEANTMIVARVTGEGSAWFTTLKGLTDAGSANLKKAQALVDEVVADSLVETKQVGWNLENRTPASS